MDFDLNAALNPHSSYVCAGQAGQQPAASVPPRLSSNDALTRPLPTRPTTYDDLPSELIARIGDYVPIQDVMPFATVDRRTYHTMQTRRLVHRYWQRANQAVSLASVNQLLDEIGGALSNPAQHAEPIDALSQRLQALPEAERVEAFKRVFAAAERIPRDGVQIQKALLRAFFIFPPSRRAELFDFAYAMAERRAPGQDNIWAELADSLQFFSSSSPFAEQRYQALLARLASLKVSEQAKLIPVLSNLLLYSDKTDPRVPERYALLRGHALQLPPSHQGASVGMLASCVRILPKAEQFAQYTQMRDWALSLPDEQWGIALQYLPEGLEELSYEQRAQELTLLEGHLARVPMSQRVSAVFGLLKCQLFLDDVQMKRAWRQGLNLLNGAGEAALWDLLRQLRAAWVLSEFSNFRWEMAVEEITRFMEASQFSEPARARFRANVDWLRSEPDNINAAEPSMLR
ncbi:hypothetical protein RA167_13930 (plasmid) [Mycetohabitans endofungorum]|uniref:hypothetical protein n=1 Tax=Mycetohabitans endofungorum TaxID=417203 RepID=UPI000967E07F|nr:hypothetical protein [Burkholderia sp. b13]SIT79807.1 hypothetical protein SAMN04487768_0329 [Burkholderia sp. b13]